MNKYIRILIAVICLCSMGFFSYKIINYLMEEKNNRKLNQQIINDVIITKTDIDEKESNIVKEYVLPIKIDFKLLKKKNKEIVGWIYLDNTPINYPVTQSNNNEYYLKRLIDGTYNSAGTIFMDYRNDNKMTDWNTVIYGHNMKNGTMFATIKKFNEQSFYEEHNNMYYLTENKNYKVELIAGYLESEDSIIYKINTNINSRNKILENAQNKSTFKSNVKIDDDDKILTLSTCSYEYEGARYVLMGVLREII